jgi:hypothetical protein
MAQTFRIADSSRTGGEHGLFIVLNKRKISEEDFWIKLHEKVREITAKEPRRFDETLATCKVALKSGSLTVLDTMFEIKGFKSPTI